MAGGAHSGRSILHLRLICLPIGNEVPQIAGGQIVARHQQMQLFCNQYDWLEPHDAVFVFGLVVGAGIAPWLAGG
jgi:hypothetical protein